MSTESDELHPCESGDGAPAAGGEPVDVPEAAPRIKVTTEPTGSRGKPRKSARRRESAVFVPPPDFAGLDAADSTPETSSATSPAPAAAESELPVVAGHRPVAEADNKRAAAKPQLPRSKSVTSGRKTSPHSWWLAVGVCGVSAAAVVVLMLYLLGRSPAGNSESSRTAATDFQLPEWNGAEHSAAPTAAPRRQPGTNRSGVRGYSAREAAQRREGIDSFAELGRSEEERLHRAEGLAPPASARPAKAPTAAADAWAAGESLLVYWPFEDRHPERASDASPRGNQAKLDGKPAAIGPGVLGAALRLDGRDDCLRVPEGLLQGAAGTISLWFRAPAVTGTQFLLSSASNSARLQLVLRDGRLAGGYAPPADREPLQTDELLRAETWHHLAVSWQSGGEVLLYLDGRPAGRQPAGQLPDPAGLLIGRDAASGRCSALDVDEIRLYARPLSADEVAALASVARG